MSKNSLIISRAIFTFIVIVSFGIIIMNEKRAQLFSPKIKKNFSSYIEDKYPKLKNDIILGNLEYKNNEFKMKITSKKTKHHYFYIKYKKQKISDTYKTDFEEGESLLVYLNEKLAKKIKKQTDVECTINNISTLNNYTEQVQNKIINEENLLSLKYYYIEKELIIDKWNSDNIKKEINNFITILNKNNITPKYYQFIITSKKDITNSIEISNIKENFTTNINNNKIISDIINNNNSELLKENNISYKYLNKEEN